MEDDGHGRAFLMDFQLAARFRRGNALFRLARYEDLRHLLKHKRRYAPDALTAAEAPGAGAEKLRHARLDGDGKEGLLRHYPRLEFHRPRGPWHALRAGGAASSQRGFARIRTCATSPSSPIPIGALAPGCTLSSRAARASASSTIFWAQAKPEHLQVVEALPRNAQGDVRSEILELVAMNQLDLIDPLLKTDAERAVVGRIVAERRNLRDRFAF